MARENVKKFFDLLSESEELQEKLQKRDREYAEAHGVPPYNASEKVKTEARLAAANEIVIPLAQEHGMEFTVDELIEYEKEMLDDIDMELDDSELSNVAGGYDGIYICCFVGGGHVDNSGGWCYVPGLSFGICFIKGVQA